MSQPSVAIVGAGIIGVSCAAFLQREGFAVTLIDRVPPGEGCSFGNAAGIVACAVEPTIHPRILTKIPGWLLDPLGPLTIRWSYLPKALPWLLAAGRQAPRWACGRWPISRRSSVRRRRSTSSTSSTG
jgi:D-amino-acid dehydrogenase